MTSNKISPWTIVAKDDLKIDSKINKVIDLAPMVCPIMDSYLTLVTKLGQPELVELSFGEVLEYLPLEHQPIVESMHKAISEIYMKARFDLIQENMISKNKHSI